MELRLITWNSINARVGAMRKPIQNLVRADFDIQVNDFVYDKAIDEVMGVPLITVYKNTTRDYPGQWVARLFDIRPGEVIATRYVMLGIHSNDLRRRVPSGMHKLNPQRNDDPNILEIWI